MTECNQKVFSFASHFSRRVEAGFTAGRVSSDGGALLLRQTDGKIGLLKRVASCFTDRRSRLLVQHQLGEMLSQRIYGLALGYEDLNDHEQLRHDPLMAVLSGRRKLEDPLARLEHAETVKAARVFTEFDYQTHKSWARARRVVAKAEVLDKGENPRFVVTSLTPDAWAARELYEKFYCARGEMENRIKEFAAANACSPIASRRKRCRAISCGCTCRRWLIRWLKRCGGWR